MGARTDAKLFGAGLEDGETYRGECPECGRAKTYTVTRRDGGLVWNCYSAKCGLTPGSTAARNHGNVLRNTLPAKKVHQVYDGELQELTDEWKDFLQYTIGFDAEHQAVARPMYAPTEHRIAFPIFGPLGVRRGWVLRSYSLGAKPKALTRMDVAEPCTSWYRSQLDTRVLVVEDIPSAVRAARYVPSVVAMNGGGVGPIPVCEIARSSQHVVWAFDQDATVSAIDHHRRYGLLFDSSEVLPLSEDLKNMKEESLCDLLSSYSEP